MRERPQLAIPMGVRVGGRDVPPEPDALAAAFPDASDRLVVFLHGLCENESYWNRGRDRLGTTYGEMLAAEGWTPVFLRANTGLGLRENGVALTALLQDVVDAWPVEVRRIALVGHSMGGLIMRAAGAVATEVEKPWTELVSDVVTLGSPHLGAPIARGVGRGQPRAGPAPGDRGLRTDPGLALHRGARPGRRPGRGRPAAAARALPAGRGHRHRLSPAPRRARGGRPAGPGRVGPRPRPEGRGPLPRCRLPPRGAHRPLRPAQPPRACTADRSRSRSDDGGRASGALRTSLDPVLSRPRSLGRPPSPSHGAGDTLVRSRAAARCPLSANSAATLRGSVSGSG